MVYRTTDTMPLSPSTTHPLLQLFGNSYERAYETGSTPYCSNGHRLHMFPYMRDRTSWRYYNTSLDQTTGLTFFFKSGRFYGVHSHTAKMPSAAQFLERFPYPIRPRLSWVYVPLPPNDDIVAMGVRGGRRRVIMVSNSFSVPELALTSHVVDSKKTERRYLCGEYSWSTTTSLCTS
jgi:hypothetical protein